MAKCDVCRRDESMPYSCRYCGGTFCSEHRLPENHDCPGLDDWGDPGGVFDSGFDDSLASQGSGGDLLNRVGVSTGPGGTLAYFRGNAAYLFLAIMWVVFLIQLLLLQAAPRLHELVFVLSSTHPEYVWTWFTAVFAHGSFGHIVVNSIVLYFFGPVVEERIGTRKFVALFFVAGVGAGLAQVGTALVAGEFSAVVGASGAIMGIMGLLTVLNPNLRVYLYFILPVPLWLLTIGFALYSVFIALGGGIGAGGVAHLAHLVGLGIGLAYGERLRRQGKRGPEQLQFGRSGPGGRRGPRRRF